MSREYKFRAWDKQEKKMYACAGFCGGQVIIIQEDGKVLGKKDEDFILMQFTGLLDKNGCEVYENDIVHATLLDYGGVRKEVIEQVEIDEGLLAPFYMRVNYEEDWWKDCLPDGFEVIGNIYENPEILKI